MPCRPTRRVKRKRLRRSEFPDPNVLAFPEGAHTTLTDVVLRECGYKVTLTTDESRVNTVVVGLPQTLIDLGRMTVLPGMTDEQLLQYLNERAN